MADVRGFAVLAKLAAVRPGREGAGLEQRPIFTFKVLRHGCLGLAQLSNWFAGVGIALTDSAFTTVMYRSESPALR